MDTKRSTKHPLEVLRLDAKLTREKLAAKAGVTSRTIYHIEREGRQPNEATIRVIAAALGCEPEDLAPPMEAAA